VQWSWGDSCRQFLFCDYRCTNARTCVRKSGARACRCRSLPLVRTRQADVGCGEESTAGVKTTVRCGGIAGVMKFLDLEASDMGPQVHPQSGFRPFEHPCSDSMNASEGSKTGPAADHVWLHAKVRNQTCTGLRSGVLASIGFLAFASVRSAGRVDTCEPCSTQHCFPSHVAC
jgi:hypothetical protein